MPFAVMGNFFYNKRMGTKLATSNRYLRDSTARDRMVLKSVASSSAIEGIRAPFKGKGVKASKSVTSGSRRTLAR